MTTNKWLPVANLRRLTYNAPLEGGGFVSDKLVALSLTYRTGKLGKVAIAPAKKDGTVHVISAVLITKVESAEQNLKYGTIRWVDA
tara:strand:+ start:142 stop:399 length:258 start_codon:yes stop_codon:yes gene_type:complete